jgi:cellobiose-specific phosphotransferase system component IIA
MNLVSLHRGLLCLLIFIYCLLASLCQAQQRSGFEAISTSPESGVVAEYSRKTEAQSQLNAQAREALVAYGQNIDGVDKRGQYTEEERASLEARFFTTLTTLRSAVTNALANSQHHVEEIDRLAASHERLAGNLGDGIQRRAEVLRRLAKKEGIAENDLFIELSAEEKKALQQHQALVKEADMLLHNGKAHVLQLKAILNRAEEREARVQTLMVKAHETYGELGTYDRVYRQMVQDAAQEGMHLKEEERQQGDLEALERYQRRVEEAGELAPGVAKRELSHRRTP